MIILLDLTLKVSVIFSIALLAMRFLRQQPAALRHWILSAAVVSAALTPLLSVMLPSLDVQLKSNIADKLPASLFLSYSEGSAVLSPAPAFPLPSANSSVTALPTASTPQQAVPSPANSDPVVAPQPSSAMMAVEPARQVQSPVDRPERFGMNLGAWVISLWLVGMVFGLALLLMGGVRLAWIASRSKRVEDPTWLRIAAEVSGDYELARPVLLLRSSRQSILAAWGVFRPQVLLPKGSDQWNEERIQVVLSHELAHVRRSDWLIQILAEAVCAFYWFNPLAWALCRRLDLESEQACDDAVLGRGIAGADYAAQLLALVRILHASGRVWTPALMMARKATLHTRFKAMLDPCLNRTKPTRLSLAFTAVVFLGTTLPVVALRVVAEHSAVVSAILQPASEARPAAAITAGVLSTLLPEPMSQLPASTSIEGIVVKLGTNEPISGVTVELTRVEGTAADPLPVSQAPFGSIASPRSLAAAAAAAGAPIPEVLPHATTGGDGRFAFRDLKPGKYTLVAAEETGAFTPAEYGQRDPRGPGIVFPVVAAQTIKDFKLQMAPTSSIGGRIFDENGEPLGRASVFALEAEYKEGRRLLNIVQAVYTNENGDYRLFWLPPGQYYVTAKIEDLQKRAVPSLIKLPGMAGSNQRSGEPIVNRRLLQTGEVIEETYGLVYYGGVVDPQKVQPIDLQSGANVAGVNIFMAPGKMRAWHIRGIVTSGVTGQPFVGMLVRANPVEFSPYKFPLVATTDANGAFDLVGAVTGSYSINALGFIPGQPGQAGNITVEVGNSDVENLKIQMWPATSFEGHVTIEGRPPNNDDPDLARISVQFLWGREAGYWPSTAPGGMEVRSSRVRADGRVSFNTNATRGFFRFKPIGIPDNTYVKSIRMGLLDVLTNGLDLTGQPEGFLEIVLGVDGSAVEGAVVNDRMNRLANTVVALVPDSPALRRRPDLYRSAISDANGQFKLQTAAPGDYKLFAWEYAEPDAWQNAEFIARYETLGKPVHVSRGGKLQEIQVTAIAARR